MERTNAFQHRLAMVRNILTDTAIAPDIRKILESLEADIEESLMEYQADPQPA